MKKNDDSREDDRGISCLKVTEAAGAAIAAVHSTYKGLTSDGEYHNRATIAALKSAIAALGGN